ncbi:MAG: SGNH/GDSL hydrolase family protein [Nitrosomonadales bacterium]|nr:SGNH/GDSL hydrolase family protein [Nitrosomonadales bacterium]
MYFVTSAILAVVAIGTTSIAHAANVDTSLRADLERIAQRRIFFGHQSVGINLLDGIAQLSKAAGVPVRIAEVSTASATPPATIGHAFVAENRDPLRKLKSFEQAMGSQPSKLDIAFVKLCYIDFGTETNVKELFTRYQATLEKLHAQNPGTTFVHVTAALTTVESGFKIRLKQLLGKAPPGTAENLRREEYNTLLRQTYQGKQPIFDLARVESTAPDGKSETVKLNGIAVPVLVPGYSDDGGHLNDSGKLRAARELISVLAAIPDRPAVRLH